MEIDITLRWKNYMILMYTNPNRPLKELLTLCLYKGPLSQIFYFFENHNLKQARVYACIIDHSKLYQKEEEESAHFLQTLSLSLSLIVEIKLPPTTKVQHQSKSQIFSIQSLH